MGNASLKVCSALGIPVEKGKLQVIPVPTKGDLIPRNSYIVFHPFAGWKFREWPDHLVREFLLLCLRSTDLSIVIVGDTSEEARVRDLTGGPENEGRVLVRIGLPPAQLASLIEHAAAFVGTDSGPYQLCALLGKPAVGLFGPNSPQISGSEVEESRAVYHKLDCSPCAQKRCVRPEAPCMALITPEEVLENMRRLLR
jgi:ADP-heptose:LPS heptosyltransferase